MDKLPLLGQALFRRFDVDTGTKKLVCTLDVTRSIIMFDVENSRREEGTKAAPHFAQVHARPSGSGRVGKKNGQKLWQHQEVV